MLESDVMVFLLNKNFLTWRKVVSRELPAKSENLFLKRRDHPLDHLALIVKERKAWRLVCGNLHYDALLAVCPHQRHTRSTIVSPPDPNTPVAIASVVFASRKARETIILIIDTSELEFVEWKAPARFDYLALLIAMSAKDQPPFFGTIPAWGLSDGGNSLPLTITTGSLSRLEITILKVPFGSTMSTRWTWSSSNVRVPWDFAPITTTMARAVLNAAE